MLETCPKCKNKLNLVNSQCEICGFDPGLLGQQSNEGPSRLSVLVGVDYSTTKEPMGCLTTIKEYAVKIIMIGVVGFVLMMVFALILDVINNRPFPPGMLEFTDENFVVEDWLKFRVRITNKASVGARKIEFRLDFFDASGKPVDGREVSFDETVPPNSTRTLETIIYSWHTLASLPKGFTWTAKFLGAKQN